MREADFLRPLPRSEEIEGLFGRLPLVQEQLAELVLFNLGESVVDDGQHQVHEEVEVDPQVGDEEERGRAAVVVGLHHHVGITGG